MEEHKLAVKFCNYNFNSSMLTSAKVCFSEITAGLAMQELNPAIKRCISTECFNQSFEIVCFSEIHSTNKHIKKNEYIIITLQRMLQSPSPYLS